MYKLLFSLLFIPSIFNLTMAQEATSNNVDNRIIEYLGDEIVSKIINERPAFMSYYTYLLNDSYEVFDLGSITEKAVKIETVSTIKFTSHDKKEKVYSSTEVKQMIEDKTFNVLTSSLKRSKSETRYYHLAETDVVIALEAENQTTTNYKKN